MLPGLVVCWEVVTLTLLLLVVREARSQRLLLGVVREARWRTTRLLLLGFGRKARWTSPRLLWLVDEALQKYQMFRLFLEANDYIVLPGEMEQSLKCRCEMHWSCQCWVWKQFYSE